MYIVNRKRMRKDSRIKRMQASHDFLTHIAEEYEKALRSMVLANAADEDAICHPALEVLQRIGREIRLRAGYPE